ncbi:MAG: Tn3 family transposase [Solirubrobacteraceae bacterium]
MLAEGLGGPDALPVARLRTLMVDVERQRAADVAKMGASRRLATLIAFAHSLRASVRKYLPALLDTIALRHTTASQLSRALRSHTRHLASLAKALQQVGRAAKTVHLFDYCNDQQFRRRILTQLDP